MKRTTNLILILALALSTAWSFADLTEQMSPRDAKVDFAESGLADHSAEAEALLAAEPGVGLACEGDEVAGMGFAGPYACNNVNLLSLTTLAELGGAHGNDSWGWTDAETGREYALMGTSLGTHVVDVTSPVNPQILGVVSQPEPTSTNPIYLAITYGYGATWRDIKVDGDHAYIVSERGGGMQVVDMTQVRGLDEDPLRELDVVATYRGEGADSFHNIFVNEDTDTAYLVGGNFSGGLHMVDISDPADPTFAGGFDADGYTHDVQCVLYEGPDTDYNGTLPGTEQQELCFASNEDTLTIVNVTDRAAPTVINKLGYDSVVYTHQGWLTPDQQFFVFNDELDETTGAVLGTTTYMVELEDLDATYTAEDVQTYVHDELSTDHNLYIVGDLIFEANYNAGLRILRYDAEGLRSGDLEEVGYFDVDTGLDVNTYGGAWNVFPFFESGTILVSSLDEGLYALEFEDPADR